MPDDTVVDSIIGFAEFARLYTANQLTLCQAFNGLRTQVFIYMQKQNVDAATAQRAVPKCGLTFELLGHKFSFDDKAAIDIGFNGDVDAWMNAGHKPKGWYQLFEDNYYDYLNEHHA